MPDDQPNQDERPKQFLRALDGLTSSVVQQAKAVAELTAISKKQLEITNKLIETVNKQVEITDAVIEVITKENDGAIPAIDDLIQVINELRNDIRLVVKGTPVAAALGQLLRRGR